MVFADKIVPGGGNDVSEIAYPVKVGTHVPDWRRLIATQP
jgi:hypothetical protein